MTVSFTYGGAVPSRPEIVTFDFVWMSYDWQFNKRNIVTAKIDKDRVDLGEAEKVGYLGLPEGRKREELVLPLSYNLFIRLINAKKNPVELRMGKAYFYLNKRTLEALRDLASRTTS